MNQTLATPMDVSQEDIDAICDRLLDSEEHAVESAIPEVAEDAVQLIRKLQGMLHKDSSEGAAAMPFKPFELIIEAYACEGDANGGPAFCRVWVDQTLIRLLEVNGTLCSEWSMQSVVVGRSPDSWDCEDTLMLIHSALHITCRDFWFSAQSATALHPVETRLMDLADLKELAILGKDTDRELPSTFRWHNGKLYYTHGQLDDFIEMAGSENRDCFSMPPVGM